MVKRLKKKQSRSPGHTHYGPLSLEEIISNARLNTIWRDMVASVPAEVTATKPEVNVTPKSIYALRIKIRAAFKNDPKIVEIFRSELRQLFGTAKDGLETALATSDASALNGFFRGLGVYRNEDSLDVTVQSPEEVQKRRLAQLEAGSGKVKK